MFKFQLFFLRFLSHIDEDLILNMFCYCMLKLSSNLAEDKRSSLEILHLNWFIEFISFLKKSAKQQVSSNYKIEPFINHNLCSEF